MNKSLPGSLLLITILILLAACSTQAENAAVETNDSPPPVECQVFYRPSPTGGFEEAILTIEVGDRHHSNPIGPMTFNTTYIDDPYEGRAFVVYVTDSETGDEIVRQLFQIDGQNGLSNQFIGGHGFTGLTYVYYPVPTSELQYFCAVQ